MEDLKDNLTSTRSDHDLLIRLETRMNEMCKDIKEVAAEVRIINARCNVQPKQCQLNFVDKTVYDIKHQQLEKTIAETFKLFKEEQHEERIKNRWFIGILVSVINVGITILIHLFPVIK